jgi:hypothetical protein
LRAAEKLPAGKKSYAIPCAIRVTHDPRGATTFSSRLDALDRRITWKPRSGAEVVERIYRLGSALLAIKEEEFMGKSRNGELVERIQYLQRYLVEQAEHQHGIRPSSSPVPLRIKALRQIIQKELIQPPQAFVSQARADSGST